MTKQFDEAIAELSRRQAAVDQLKANGNTGPELAAAQLAVREQALTVDRARRKAMAQHQQTREQRA